jgi:hypothetical protein
MTESPSTPFSFAGTLIKIPGDHPELEVIWADIDPFESCHTVIPIRKATNFIIVEKKGNERFLVKSIGKQIKVEVEYTAEDLATADWLIERLHINLPEGAHKLCLAYWNGCGWIPFTAEEHGFDLLPLVGQVGIGKASFSYRGDPPMIWGVPR